MMKAKHQWTQWNRIVAMSVPFFACTATTPLAANGGTIHFTGVIVAPPFELSTKNAVTKPPGIDNPGYRSNTDADSLTTIVTFVAPAHNAPSAEISLIVNDAGTSGRVVAANFTDRTTQAVPLIQKRAYHVGAAGGSLSLSLTGSKTGAGRSSADTLITVVTSYD
jgi:hypothetical protein